MRIDQNVKITPGADKLKQGQFMADVAYGILRDSYSETLKNVYINDISKEGDNG